MKSRPGLFAPLLTSALLVVVLVQAFLLEHELEHTLSGDDDSCLVCHLAGHQGDALISSAGNPAPLKHVAALTVVIYTFRNPHQSHFSPRAPPTPALL